MLHILKIIGRTKVTNAESRAKSILVASAAIHPKVVVLWLLIHCLLLLPMFVFFFVFGPCLCNAVLNVLSSFSLRKRAMVALL